MEEASKERPREMTSCDESQMKKGPSTASQAPVDFHSLNPFLRVSPRHDGSILYDSFELQALTRQLNKAMQISIASSPTYIRYLQSPLYSQRLDHFRKEKANAPKKVSSRTTENRKARTKVSKTVIGGFVARLWRKVRQGVLKSRQRRMT